MDTVPWKSGPHSVLSYHDTLTTTNGGKMIIKILQTSQPALVVILFLSFLVIFGIPSYNEYIKYDILTRETKTPSSPLDSPAVTVCVDSVRGKWIKKI